VALYHIVEIRIFVLVGLRDGAWSGTLILAVEKRACFGFCRLRRVVLGQIISLSTLQLVFLTSKERLGKGGYGQV
jgi:hypothetical protein